MAGIAKDVDILANRFNAEPVAMMGCTQQEVMRLVMYLVIPAGILGGILFLPLLKNYLFGFSAGLCLGVGMFFLTMKWLQRFRKDQVPGYLTQIVQAKLSRNGIAFAAVFHRSGTWMVGRKL